MTLHVCLTRSCPGTRDCDIEIRGADGEVDLLQGGIDGHYKLMGCFEGKPMYVRFAGPAGGGCLTGPGWVQGDPRAQLEPAGNRQATPRQGTALNVVREVQTIPHALS